MSSEKAKNEMVYLEIPAGELIQLLSRFQVLFGDSDADSDYEEIFKKYYDWLFAAYEKTLLFEEMKISQKRLDKILAKIGAEMMGGS